MADSTNQKGAEGTKMATSGAPHPSSSPISRSATPSTSKKVTEKLGSFFRKPFLKSKSRTPEPTPASDEIAQDQNPQVVLPPAPDTLLVKIEGINLQGNAVDPAKQIAGYELAIKVIDIFQSVAESTDFVLPTPVGMLLEQLTKALGALKVRSFAIYDGDPTNVMACSKW